MRIGALVSRRWPPCARPWPQRCRPQPIKRIRIPVILSKYMQSKPFGSRFFLLLAGACVAFGQQYSVSTIAGGAPPPTPSAALSTPIGQPNRAAVDASGNVYFSSGNSVFKIAGNTVMLLAGNSRPGFSGDGGAAVSAQLN